MRLYRSKKEENGSISSGKHPCVPTQNAAEGLFPGPRHAPGGDQGRLSAALWEITVAHTDATIHEFSVTSFYTIGLALGWIEREDMVSGY